MNLNLIRRIRLKVAKKEITRFNNSQSNDNEIKEMGDHSMKQVMRQNMINRTITNITSHALHGSPYLDRPHPFLQAHRLEAGTKYSPKVSLKRRCGQGPK